MAAVVTSTGTVLDDAGTGLVEMDDTIGPLLLVNVLRLVGEAKDRRSELDVDAILDVRLADNVVLENAGGGGGGITTGFVTVVVVGGIELINTVDVIVVVTVVDPKLRLEDIVGGMDSPFDTVKVVVESKTPPLDVAVPVLCAVVDVVAESRDDVGDRVLLETRDVAVGDI